MLPQHQMPWRISEFATPLLKLQGKRLTLTLRQVNLLRSVYQERMMTAQFATRDCTVLPRKIWYGVRHVVIAYIMSVSSSVRHDMPFIYHNAYFSISYIYCRGTNEGKGLDLRLLSCEISCTREKWWGGQYKWRISELERCRWHQPCSWYKYLQVLNF